MEYIDIEPAESLAKRLCARIPHSAARKRFTKLLLQEFLSDATCARPLTPEEAEAAPDWVRRKCARGQTVSAFVCSDAMQRRTKAHLRLLRAAIAELAYLDSLPLSETGGAEAALRAQAEDFFQKIARMNYCDIVAKARTLARARTRRQKFARDSRRRFPSHEIYAAPGRVWARIVSVAELGLVGVELRNCLSPGSGRHARYASLLRLDAARFWVLRDHAGTAIAAVMVSVEAQRIVECGARSNARIPRDDPDLAVLVRALGLAERAATFLEPPDLPMAGGVVNLEAVRRLLVGGEPPPT